MCFKFTVITFACLSGLMARRIPYLEESQAASIRLASSDNIPAASVYGDPAAAIHAGSKHFQYIHVPAKDHYEHGHKRGNEQHFIDRHDKGHPHVGEFKTKVRWGDKHGGYGEHYWDLNHAGHGQETRQIPQYAAYVQETRPAAAYAKILSAQRGKREQGLLDDVEFINDNARSLILNGNAPQHGGNYRSAFDSRGKREEQKISEEDLTFEPESDTSYGKKAGNEYGLKRID